MYHAIIHGNVHDVIALLHDNEVDVNCTNINGQTPLHVSSILYLTTRKLTKNWGLPYGGQEKRYRFEVLILSVCLVCGPIWKCNDYWYPLRGSSTAQFGRQRDHWSQHTYALGHWAQHEGHRIQVHELRWWPWDKKPTRLLVSAYCCQRGSYRPS